MRTFSINDNEKKNTIKKNKRADERKKKTKNRTKIENKN